ncbi:MAG TPA: BMP family ABC transporter substrate-binding protein [Ruminiclostridium sp.]|nr:BMP family ABC transporter substrate-binding protein [Ruminiclostridium sp.]
MKRLTALMLAIVTVGLAVLTGCGLSKTDSSAASSSVAATSSSAASESKTSAAGGLKVGFIYIGSVGDVGYTYAHDQGRLYLEKTLASKGVTTVKAENVPETADCEKAINNLIDQGCKVIFATSLGYMDFVEKAAKEHPDVKFFHCSGNKSNGTNFVNYFGQIEEARYLSGIVAGMKTKSNKIGYVAAMQVPEVIRGIDFFTLGVRSVNPKAVVNVKWTNTWYDPQKEKDAATALLNEGNDIIAQHQDSTAAQIAAQEKGAYAIGYNSDSSKAAPKAYLTAPVWNWGVYYVDQVQKILDGTWKPENYLGGMKDGVVDLAPMSDLVDPAIKAKVEEAKKKILDGSLKVLAGPIKDQTGAVKIADGKVMTVEEQQSCKWFVEGVNGKINK